MLNPSLRQQDLRRPRPARNSGAADHVRLAGRLTARDRWILRMLYEHRVLTTHQLAALAFPTGRIARRRLLILHRCGGIDRFQPLRPSGSAPDHWVLAPAGAAVVGGGGGAGGGVKEGIEPTPPAAPGPPDRRPPPRRNPPR
ncbi:replication-relaxation family protein, partial [Nocardia carnea]|uniref:replication-relaxation family protein n=1 Tax=Nocardia carnea TaxID=37328 RepID=UPI002457A288